MAKPCPWMGLCQADWHLDTKVEGGRRSFQSGKGRRLRYVAVPQWKLAYHAFHHLWNFVADFDSYSIPNVCFSGAKALKDRVDVAKPHTQAKATAMLVIWRQIAKVNFVKTKDTVDKQACASIHSASTWYCISIHPRWWGSYDPCYQWARDKPMTHCTPILTPRVHNEEQSQTHELMTHV